MASVAEDVKNLVVYFDHEDLFGEVNGDDDVANLVSDLPKVISPCKVQYVEKNPTQKLLVFYTNLEDIRVDQAIDNELESGSEDDVLWDSGNEIEEEDAHLFEDLVSSHVNVIKDNKKAKESKLKTLVISRPVQGSDEEDTDDEGLETQPFMLAQCYSVKNRVEIKMPRNDKTRVKAHCADGCPWNLFASLDTRSNSFVVKTYYGPHNCQKE